MASFSCVLFFAIFGASLISGFEASKPPSGASCLLQRSLSRETVLLHSVQKAEIKGQKVRSRKIALRHSVRKAKNPEEPEESEESEESEEPEEPEESEDPELKIITGVPRAGLNQSFPSPSLPGINGNKLQAKAKVFFLFMLRDGILHPEVWESFFAAGEQGIDYEALVHCKNETACRADKGLAKFRIIPSVKTEYCTNLVSGMNTLLYHALSLPPGNEHDKFTYVSESTLPAKPFKSVYEQLTSDSNSAFCVQPRSGWPVWSGKSAPESEVRFAVKTSQWMTLSRSHGQALVRRAASDDLQVNQMRLMTDLRLNTLWPGSAYGCLDEFWAFNALTGGVNTSFFKFLANATEVALQAGAYELAGEDLSALSITQQGRCDTFVYWDSDDDDGNFSNATQLGQAMKADGDTLILRTGEWSHPSTLYSIGQDSLIALRKSRYLFVRKVSENCTANGTNKPFAEAYKSIVFSDKV
eukprot:TRINITY_DN14053_c0_g1_i1.p1 TRINITY_DN14053_c0_g1~~TRINITY_DN14053_c0_g1_i1.p1  ORF type:complete len:471 (-),score=84.68 TRINITY_DN14053_c0_g1_i1:81-1493(-)